MKSLDLKLQNVQVMNDDELRLVDGGFLFGFSTWFKIGLSIGAAGGAAYLAANEFEC